jgi:hypothetical protein
MLPKWLLINSKLPKWMDYGVTRNIPASYVNTAGVAPSDYDVAGTTGKRRACRHAWQWRSKALSGVPIAKVLLPSKYIFRCREFVITSWWANDLKAHMIYICLGPEWGSSNNPTSYVDSVIEIVWGARIINTAHRRGALTDIYGGVRCVESRLLRILIDLGLLAFAWRVYELD